MKSENISKNLEELLIFLMQDQLNNESSQLIKEIIHIKKVDNKNRLTKSLLIKNFSNNIKNISDIYIENIIEKLINLDFIEFNEEKNEGIIIKINNILNILFYPRYCYYINNKYGPKCLKIIEYLLEFGFYIDNINKFSKNDFSPLIRDGIIIKTKIEKIKNDDIFNSNSNELFRINYKLLNEIMFKENIINYYKKYISMNFQFYELFKKVVYSTDYIYELKNYEKNNFQLSQTFVDNLNYDKILIKDDTNNKIILNKEYIKYDLFYNSIEIIINLFYSPKHLRILKIIQLNQNLNLIQISQKACLKYLEVQEILDDLINKLVIVKKIKKEKDGNDFIYLLNDLDEDIINLYKDNIYGIIKNIKYELKDKLKELQGRIDKDMVIQYINKYYSLINTFSEILNSYNFILV